MAINCKYHSPEEWEESRRLFEIYAGLHINGKKRWTDPYFGAVIWNRSCYKKIKHCPLTYEAQLEMSVVQLREYMQDQVESNIARMKEESRVAHEEAVLRGGGKEVSKKKREGWKKMDDRRREENALLSQMRRVQEQEQARQQQQQALQGQQGGAQGAQEQALQGGAQGGQEQALQGQARSHHAQERGRGRGSAQGRGRGSDRGSGGSEN